MNSCIDIRSALCDDEALLVIGITGKEDAVREQEGRESNREPRVERDTGQDSRAQEQLTCNRGVRGR
jgi:hypothetical protein